MIVVGVFIVFGEIGVINESDINGGQDDSLPKWGRHLWLGGYKAVNAFMSPAQKVDTL